MNTTFWESLAKPIIGLSPMDGVTDAAFRYITDIYGKPDILYTEFVPVEALERGIAKLLPAFVHHKTKTPTLAQVYGTSLKGFYQSAFIAGEMGFDGIDINMGCPAINVAKRGAGAGLIRTPKLAQQIIRKTKKGVKDWAAGKTMKEAGIEDSIIEYIDKFKKKFQITPIRSELPVSVKTRIGFDKIVTTEWIGQVLEAEPVTIALHGRTLKQLYSGEANWEEIGKAAEVIHKTRTFLLGNGDVHTKVDAREKVDRYHTDGVLIGRATFGNPWIFQEIIPTKKMRLDTLLEHCKVFLEMTPEMNFYAIRKHMVWYCKEFEGAVALRVALMKTHTLEEVRTLLQASE